MNGEEIAQMDRCSMYKFVKGNSAGEFDAQQQQHNPLLDREKFAISLRREKRKSIICSKRKKTLEQIGRNRADKACNPLQAA